MIFEKRIKIIKGETGEAARMYRKGKYNITKACMLYVQEIVGYAIAELDQKMNEKRKKI